MTEIIISGQVPQSFQQEDMQYMKNALDQAKMGKQYDIAGMLEMGIFHNRKAFNIVDQLYNLRKEKYPGYQILLAPFYYKVGDSIVSYIECNMNEMNQLKPLELPEDPDEEDVETQEKLDAIEEEKVPEEENKDPNKDEDEPIIEDVIDSK